MDDKRQRVMKWFFAVLTNPGGVFQQMVEQPAFFKPALLACGINVLLTLVLLPKIREFTLWTLKSGVVQLPPEQLAAGQNVAVIAATVASVLAALAGPWFLWLVVAVLLKIYDLFGARGTRFGALFAVAVYGYLPVLIGNLIRTAVVIGAPVENFAKISLSLAAFLPYQKSFLYFFLTGCNPFVWWSLLLWGIGGAAAMKSRGYGGVFALLFGSWLVYTVVTALYALAKVPAGIGF
ncbi:MAG: YIP1 family protein [Syntrophothermus sp.]|uniref:YIP1 family protein n=1 Tax=Syntrophothermus sp. TaxID=2736299 RepID=UPI00257E840B|nr:YIP1 family protein [Syntrophothermus sp.]NSW83029.1 YIP1 family protein [Syntrophothermus sp.]